MPFCAHCGREISGQAVACSQCGHPGPSGTVAIATTTAGSYAGWWQRVGAAVIDGVVVTVPALVLVFVSFAAIGAATEASAESPTVDAAVGIAFFLIMGVAFVLIGLYRVLMEGSARGQTLGKMAVGIRVRDAETRERIGYGRAAARFAVSFLMGAVPFGSLLDVLFPLWDPRHQTVHDKAARTVVVRL